MYVYCANNSQQVFQKSPKQIIMLEFHNVPLKTILRRAIMSLPTN
ncbi:hypothetical protein ACLRAQ_004763, partial [Salmonella enterica subsp. enterica serovar Typhimurium]